MSEPNQNDINADEKQVFDDSIFDKPQEDVAEVVENSVSEAAEPVLENSPVPEPAAPVVENNPAPAAAPSEPVVVQDFINQATAPAQNVQPNNTYGQPMYDAYGQPVQNANQYGQPVNQAYDPNAQYGYAASAPGYAPGYAPAPGMGSPKSKVAAGVLGIVLGGLGIHKFYLGYTVPGVIMLLISVLTLGMLAIVPAVIGIVEGIMYLTMDDAQFYNTYVVGKKEWF